MESQPVPTFPEQSQLFALTHRNIVNDPEGEDHYIIKYHCLSWLRHTVKGVRDATSFRPKQIVISS